MPGWSTGWHGNCLDVQNYIQPLCKQYGVSIVISGHNHLYARAVADGVQHITTGGGGAPLHDPDPNRPNLVKYDKSHYFIKVIIDNNTLEFKAIRDDGFLIEDITLYK